MYWAGLKVNSQNKLGELHMKLRDNPPPHVKPIHCIKPTQNTPPKPTQTHEKSTPKKKSVSGDGMILTDSIASRIDGHYMYKQKKSMRVQVLPGGQKTLGGATQYIKETDIKVKSLSIVAGSNDVCYDSVDAAVYRAKHLITTAKRETAPSTQLSLYAIPPRKKDPRWRDFETKRTEYNKAMCKFCNDNGVKFIETSISTQDICEDNVHLYYGQERLIVRDIKKVINPIFGLSRPQYSDECEGDYTQEGNVRQTQGGYGYQGAWGPTSQSYNYNYGQYQSSPPPPPDFSTPSPMFTGQDFPPLSKNGQQDQVYNFVQDLARLFKQANLMQQC